MNTCRNRSSSIVVAIATIFIGVLAACTTPNVANITQHCLDTSSGTATPPSTASDPTATTLVKSIWVIDGTPNKFSRPTSLAQDEQGNLYVVDGGNQRIQKFDCNGKLLTKWGERGNGEGQFVFLDGSGHYGSVTADQQGHIYVADHNFRIQKFSTDGKFLTQWGSKGNGEGQFGEFINLATDLQGNVYAVDTDNQRIQKFDGDGKFLAKWSNPKCSFYTPRPFSIAVNAHGDILTTDAQSHCIQKFDSNGNFLSTVGKFAETDLPVGIALDEQGNIYITDNQVGFIWKFDSNGNLLATWNSSDSHYGKFDSPQGITVDALGNVYVVEVHGERIRKFRQP